MLSDVYVSDDVNDSIDRVIENLNSVVDVGGNRVLTIKNGSVLVHTRMQALFNLKFSREIDRRIYELIITHAVEAERMGPGGFDGTITTILSALREKKRAIRSTVFEKSRAVLEAGAALPKAVDLEWVIKKHGALGSDRDRVMVTEALRLAGFAGRIVLERTKNLTVSVEQVCGYTFQIKPLISVSGTFTLPKVAVIDGIVESVAEIHQLLEASHESKMPMLLFVRGAAPDVLNTLSVNWNRGTLRVVPVRVPFDETGINVLKDIAIVSGCDVISSAKGELISTVNYVDLPQVKEVSVWPDRISVLNPSSRDAVNSHVTYLRKRREDAIEDALVELYDSRIRALSPNHVTIRICDDKGGTVSSQAIDYMLRAVRSLIGHGSVEIDGERELTATVMAIHAYASRCVNALVDLGAVIACQEACPG